MSKHRRRNILMIIAAGIIGLILALGLLRPGLNDAERQLVGTWEFTDSPGDQLVHFDRRGAGWYLFRKGSGTKDPIGWQIKDGQLVLRMAPGSLKSLRIAMGVQIETEEYPIRFDGVSALLTVDGKDRVMIKAENQEPPGN